MRSFVVLLISTLVIVTVVTGLMAFFLPFDIVVTRIHAATAPAFALFVGWHVIQNRKSLARYLTKRFRVQQAVLVGCVAVFGTVVYLNLPPIDLWMARSYESRQADIIFRPPADVTTHRISGRIQIKRDSEQVPIWFDARLTEPDDTDIWIAIWMENDLGEMLDTLYLSESLAFVEAVEVEGTEKTRADLLPLWATRWAAGRVEREEFPSGVDAVTQATPKLVFDFDALIRSPRPRFSLLMEVRRGGSDPQVYTVMIDLDRLKRYYLLDLLGVSTERGTIRYDTADLELHDLFVDRALVRIDDQRSTQP